MITLELTDDEATNLMHLLGVHSTASSVDTFSVFDKLSNLIDPDHKRSNLSAAFFMNELLPRVTQADNGLIEIKP